MFYVWYNIGLDNVKLSGNKKKAILRKRGESLAILLFFLPVNRSLKQTYISSKAFWRQKNKNKNINERNSKCELLNDDL